MDGPLTAYWLAILRVLTGWWFFHSGVTKLLEGGLAYSYGPIYMQGMEGRRWAPSPYGWGTIWRGSSRPACRCSRR